MALQDLTPQLRTRLSKVERAVGWFVILAAMLLMGGFVYYAWHTASRKGWFLTKVEYQTGVNNVAGLKVRDPVKLMGNDVGEITDITPNNPSDYYGMTVTFNVRQPHFGYIWSDSVVKVSADLFGKRFLEVTKGVAGVPTVILTTNQALAGSLKYQTVRERQRSLLAQNKPLPTVLAELNAEARTNHAAYYEPVDRRAVCWIDPDESPALNERIERIADLIEASLPNILDLTNRLGTVLDEGITATENANKLLIAARPIVDNLERITVQITDPQGSLGEWLMPADIREQLTNALAAANDTLLSANSAVTNSNERITVLAVELERALENLTSITGNLNAQVAANPELVKEISNAIIHADELVQGLKRHWLLRSAFKDQSTNPPPTGSGAPRSDTPGRLRAGKPIW